ncbi:hypothetical protein BGZ70_001745 [Mortierella alpina]|uniref:Tetratricopeptide repeat and J domain-containing co-chaperone DNJ1 n=1 Tax=Mortierella alpina TaxID=64518 RepID=A0A9P6M5J9_MORAP|nr:hypothetical protein BGZ70_001745 [Mortierella alpina]
MKGFLLLSLLALCSVLAAASHSTEWLLDQAKNHQAKGEYLLALKNYDAAIDQDPNNYLAYARRAATYLALGRNNQALADFTTILDLKPDFYQALLQRGKLYALSGQFERATKDLKRYLRKHKNDDSALEVKTLLSNIQSASGALKPAVRAMAKGQPDECIKLLDRAILTAPLHVPFRLQRAECHLRKGNMEQAVHDLSSMLANADTDPKLLLRLSTMTYYSLYQPEQALAQVKRCIRFDPENKQCKALFKKLKKTEKDVNKLDSDLEKKRWAGVINKAVGGGDASLVRTIELETASMEQENLAVGNMPKRLLLKLYSAVCKAYTETKDKNSSLKWCTKTLSVDESNLDGLIGRGTAHLLSESYEEAIRDLTKAQEVAGGQDRRIRELLAKAQRLLTQSQQKDHYKTLGVPRTASEQEIKKAFRIEARKWHPDTYRGDLPQEQVEKKMAAVNEAYEVLSDPELKARYDNGEDPNSPQGQQAPFTQGSNGQPFFFQQGGAPFGQAGGGSGAYSFKFNF